MPIKILVVDDADHSREILKLTLAEQDYEVLEARDGEEAMAFIKSHPLNLVLLDYKIPKLNGTQICRRVKKDLLLSHLPIIMVTNKNDTNDRVSAIDAGADDYVTKPFEPKELLARIRMVLRRTERDLEANPLSRLPGNISILNELSRRLKEKSLFAVCYIDLGKFKSYNDKYGFEHGDRVIHETARILISSVRSSGNPDSFIGHIGGDDFVVITEPAAADELCKKIIGSFDKSIPSFYNQSDRRKGYIIAHDRKGVKQKIPLVSIAIGIVTNEFRRISHVAQIGQIGAELKALAKLRDTSHYVKDKRKSDEFFAKAKNSRRAGNMESYKNGEAG